MRHPTVRMIVTLSILALTLALTALGFWVATLQAVHQ